MNDPSNHSNSIELSVSDCSKDSQQSASVVLMTHQQQEIKKLYEEQLKIQQQQIDELKNELDNLRRNPQFLTTLPQEGLILNIGCSKN